MVLPACGTGDKEVFDQRPAQTAVGTDTLDSLVDSVPVTTLRSETGPGVPVGVRQTRQLGGVYPLRNDDVVTAARFPTGVARCPWPIELHSGEKPRLTWLFGDSYEVPYECFVPQRGESLLVAGRCLAAEHEAMASARVTAQCFSYGHAIGHAAALAVTERMSPRSVSGRDVRNLLNRDGAQLG